MPQSFYKGVKKFSSFFGYPQRDENFYVFIHLLVRGIFFDIGLERRGKTDHHKWLFLKKKVSAPSAHRHFTTGWQVSVNSLGPSLPGAVLLLKMDAVASSSSSWVIRRQRGNITRYSPFKSNGNGQERLILLVSFKSLSKKKGYRRPVADRRPARPMSPPVPATKGRSSLVCVCTF